MRGQLMDIYIMGSKIDFRVENERTIRDVIENISEVVYSYGQSITELRIDGKIYYPTDPELENILIDNVRVLEINIASFFEVSASLIFSLIPYVRKFKELIKSDLIDQYQFDEAKQWIIDALVSSTDMIFVLSYKSKWIKTRNEIVGQLQETSFGEIRENEENREKLLDTLQTLENLLTDLTKIFEKIENDGEIVFDSSIDNDISEMLELTEEISLSLQLGNDNEALNRLYEFADAFLDLFYYLNISIKFIKMHQDLYEKFKSYNFPNISETSKIIENIIAAINQKDFVYASDLLSYELKPKIEEISTLIKDIREIISSKFYTN
jgi:phage anti-repressor protein